LIDYYGCWVAYYNTVGTGIVSDIIDRFSDLDFVLEESSDLESSDSLDYPEFAAYFCEVSDDYVKYYRNPGDDDDDDDGDDDDGGDDSTDDGGAVVKSTVDENYLYANASEDD